MVVLELILVVLLTMTIIGAKPVIGINNTLSAFTSCSGHVSDEQETPRCLHIT